MVSFKQSILVASFLASTVALTAAQPTYAQPSQSASAVSPDIISGTVTSGKGPEAGVWVIAETKDFQTPFTKIVVTDDQGRYVLPQMPNANYEVWVRGYGLVDSKHVTAKPGQRLDLQAVVAPNARAAALYYPAAWWFAMLKIPQEPAAQKEFVLTVKECLDCHQLGDLATRKISPLVTKGTSSSLAAWDKRTSMGPSSAPMSSWFQSLGEGRKAFSDFTDSVAAGAYPTTGPKRPSGVERNIVITEWDWGPHDFGRMDMEASNPINPGVNANGPVFGVSEMNDGLEMVDPVKNTAEEIHVPSAATKLTTGIGASDTPDPWFGADVWNRKGDPRSTLVLPDGRVMVTDRNKADANTPQPAFCTQNAFGKYFPKAAPAQKGLAIYDYKTKKWEFIDTCFSVDHNVMDNKHFIYFGAGNAFGWVDLDTWNKTHDAEKSQGWCPVVIDTNGDGKITPGWTEPTDPVDPTKDHRINFGSYGVAFSEKDQSVWAAGIGRGDRTLTRLIKGAHPPETCRGEVFVPPDDAVFGSGGVAATSDGVIWQNWRVSGHFTAFDPSKCGGESKDPTGKFCSQGWTIYNNPEEPRYAGSPYKADESYLAEVDAHNILGLGEAPLYYQTNTDSLEAFNRANSQFVTLRVPYPMGYYIRSANGRIDDPKAGWKGKGMWTTYGSYAGWHQEGPGYPDVDPPGGTTMRSHAVKFQVRPDPLAH